MYIIITNNYIIFINNNIIVKILKFCNLIFTIIVIIISILIKRVNKTYNNNKILKKIT